MTDEKIFAPWTEEQVILLNAMQAEESLHPYTCRYCNRILVATDAGWICPKTTCVFLQHWALPPMTRKELDAHRQEFRLLKLESAPDEDSLLREMDYLLKKGQKINAIKLWRNVKGVTLKESKRRIDQRLGELGL
jgi:hypothetical protein